MIWLTLIAQQNDVHGHAIYFSFLLFGWLARFTLSDLLFNSILLDLSEIMSKQHFVLSFSPYAMLCYALRFDTDAPLFIVWLPLIKFVVPWFVYFTNQFKWRIQLKVCVSDWVSVCEEEKKSENLFLICLELYLLRSTFRYAFKYNNNNNTSNNNTKNSKNTKRTPFLCRKHTLKHPSNSMNELQTKRNTNRLSKSNAENAKKTYDLVCVLLFFF